ncbi:MAG: hypothetical protein OXP66_19315, partial [Candidatus Tectomicrobia bacterium]|nr:hypothetical protein [Candidatus Tectomicrobia bacterium]
LWFEDLPECKQIPGGNRILISTFGVFTFVFLYLLVNLDTVVTRSDAPISILILPIFAYCIVLGFLLAWKRERSGPVRLFISGVALPSLVIFLVRSSSLLGVG